MSPDHASRPPDAAAILLLTLLGIVPTAAVAGPQPSPDPPTLEASAADLPAQRPSRAAIGAAMPASVQPAPGSPAREEDAVAAGRAARASSAPSATDDGPVAADPAAPGAGAPEGADPQAAGSPASPEGQPPAASGPEPVAKGPMGGGDGISFASSDGNYSMRIGIIGQVRFRAYDQQQVRRTSRAIVSPPIPVEDISEVQKSFSIRLLRLTLSGNTFRPWLTYKLETDMVANDQGLREVFIPPVDPVTGSNAVLLRAGAETLDGRTLKVVDFYLDGSPRQVAGFRLGQFKVPFGRQELVSDHLLQLPERSIALNFFAPGRDRGMVFKGETPEGKIGYQAGVFNGVGIDQAQNLDDSLAYAFRLTATSGGPYLDVESILDSPPSFQAQGGASWYDSTRRTTQTSDPLSLIGDIEDSRLSFDMEFLWPKANLLMEYFTARVRTDDNVSDRMQTICFGAYEQGLLTCHQQGFNIQGGVLLAGRHELSGRYSEVDPDRDLERDKLKEATLGYTFFFKRHALSWSTSLSALTLEVNAPGSSGLSVQQGDSSIPIVPGFPNPQGFVPELKDDHNSILITQLQWMF